MKDRNRSLQIERITKNERIMREASDILNMREIPKESSEQLCDLMSELESYYLSEEWKNDYADDEAGLLPKDLKRGVLSQDGIFDLLDVYNEFIGEQEHNERKLCHWNEQENI